MSFTPRIGAAGVLYTRMQSTDAMLRAREEVLASTLIGGILQGGRNIKLLATEISSVRELRQSLNNLETKQVALQNDVRELDRRISHMAWVFPEDSVHSALAKKEKKVAQLAELNQRLASIYSTKI